MLSRDLEFEKLLRSFEILRERQDQWLKDYMAGQKAKEQAEKRRARRQKPDTKPTKKHPKPFQGTSSRPISLRPKIPWNLD